MISEMYEQSRILRMHKKCTVEIRNVQTSESSEELAGFIHSEDMFICQHKA